MMFFRKKKKEQEREEELKRSKIEMFLSAGMTYFKKRSYTDARRYFEKILLIDPNNEDVKRYLMESVKKAKFEEEKQNSETEINSQFQFKQQPAISDFKLKKEIKADTNIDNEKDKLFFFKTLRIDSDACDAEIKLRISQEFKKWRTRVNSPDLKIRYEAEEMLTIISQARRILVKSNKLV